MLAGKHEGPNQFWFGPIRGHAELWGRARQITTLYFANLRVRISSRAPSTTARTCGPHTKELVLRGSRAPVCRRWCGDNS
jgi:hypothetical protein